MQPAARLAAVIDVLAALEKTPEPADKVLREFFRARRYAGSKDRAAVAERLYTVLRHHYSYAWRMKSAEPRRLVIASLLAEGADPAEFFTGTAYSPAALTDEESAAVASVPEAPPRHVQGEFPAWLEPELEKAFGADLLAEMAAMGERAAVDIRVNTLKTSHDALIDALASEGFAATPTPHAATGLRLSGTATSKLSASPLFTSGQFEFQDEAAQFAAALCGATPSSRVLDYAAGAGGKTLALAAAMHNKGAIVAHDIDSGRLSMLEPRATRAGATIIKISTAAPTGVFDIVLLDSPCSGTGTWRRQPELRVRLTPDRLAGLTALQTELLSKAAAFVKPGGRLVYATCSVLRCENEDQIAAFCAAHPDFAPVPVSPPETFFRASPHRTGTDGFFTAILQRAP
jgi:16S rRNA (cytosine967-C5)-methyltransferase